MGSGPIQNIRLADGVMRAAQPGSWRLQLAPLPAWTSPRVGQDQRGGLSWTLLHLRLALWAAHLSLNFPQFAVGADVDVPAMNPDVTIPPVMLNSHVSNLGQETGIGVGQSCESFSPAGWTALSDPVVFGPATCATARY
jgi:hypothetical protein